MRSLNLHLKVLIAILLTLGMAITAYQILIQRIPATETETDDLWNTDTKVDLAATLKTPVKVQTSVPPLNQDYVNLNESFISSNYGISINRADSNRRVTWSVHRANGKRTLYYHLMLAKRYAGEKTKEKGPTFRDSLSLEDPEKIAAKTPPAPIRQHSADAETFVSEAIKRANNGSDDSARLLVAGDTSLKKKAHIVETLLSIAHAPMKRVHTIRLIADPQQSPELWLRSFNGENWLYFNMVTGEQGLPSGRLT